MIKNNQFIIGFKNGFLEFSHTISISINTIFLLIIYILGIGLTSIIAKITGKTFISTKNKNKNSYWQDLSLTTKSKEKYYQQF